MKRRSVLRLDWHGPLAGLLLAALVWAGGCDCNGTSPQPPPPPPPPPPAPAPARVHDLQVSRFTSSALTDARAGQILAGMGPVLQNVDSAGDVACDVGFTRNGNVTVFATGTGAINSQADFQAVNSLAGNVKVVNQINWCGGLAPNIIGCAPVPGDSLVVVRFTANLEEILWVHEFGHNQGRSHRTGTDLVMHPSIGATRRGVNQAECDAYLQP